MDPFTPVRHRRRRRRRIRKGGRPIDGKKHPSLSFLFYDTDNGDTTANESSKGPRQLGDHLIADGHRSRAIPLRLRTRNSGTQYDRHRPRNPVATTTMANVKFRFDKNYTIMTINSQIVYKPTDQCNDPEPDNDHEVYIGNLPLYYTIEKFIEFAK